MGIPPQAWNTGQVSPQTNLDPIPPAYNPPDSPGNHHWIFYVFLFLFISAAAAAIGYGASFYMNRQNSGIPKPLTGTPTPIISAFQIEPTIPVSPDSTSSAIPLTPPPQALVDKLVNSHNVFGLNLFQKLTANNKNENIFISPLSITLALSMVYNGSGTTTKSAIGNTLNLTGLTTEELNQLHSYQLHKYSQSSADTTLKIANSLWLRNIFQGQTVTLNPTFSSQMQADYGAKIAAMNFDDPKTVDVINGWVSDATNNKIKNIINPPIDPNNLLILINAIYFKGNWSIPFDKKLTVKDFFTNSNNQKVEASVMKQSDDYLYFEDRTLQMISLPYGKNQESSMMIILPKTDTATYLKSFTLDKWKSLITKLGMTHGTLSLPVFSNDYEIQLNDILKSMGMSIAFDGNKADFNKILDLDKSPVKSGLYIGKVLHKSYINVDEQGTEAAAVTSVNMAISSSIGSNPIKFTMEVNKPFIYMIVDNKTQELLFIGIMNTAKT